MSKSISFRPSQTNFLDKNIREKLAQIVNNLPYEFDTRKIKYYEDGSVEFFGKTFSQKDNRLIDSCLRFSNENTYKETSLNF